VSDNPTQHAEYEAGDTYSYRSVTQLHVVTWTRDAEGVWWPDDDRGCTATDDDIRQAREGSPDV
jgi:hypothetical protein